MEEQEFVIKGTVEGMIKILQSDFEMSFGEAKFFVYTMINQHKGDVVNTINKEELDVWYLSKEEKYEGQILNTHLAINFTTVKMNLCHTAYIFLVQRFFNRGIDLVMLGADVVFAVGASIKKIKDTDYCVYARILELCVGNKDRFFQEEDIITANKYGKCDYQDDEWKCTYLAGEEECVCDKQKISQAFKNLEEQKIIKRAGDRWLLVR